MQGSGQDAAHVCRRQVYPTLFLWNEDSCLLRSGSLVNVFEQSGSVHGMSEDGIELEARLMEDERLWGFFTDKCIGFWEGFLGDETDWPPNDEVEEYFELHFVLISEFIELYELVDCTESRVLSCLLLTDDGLRIKVALATALLSEGSERKGALGRDGGSE